MLRSVGLGHMVGIALVPEGWSARDVLSHNIGMCQMITGIARGHGSESAGQPEVVDPLDEWGRAC